MKKLLLTMLTVCMIFSITYGYNLTKIVNGNKLITTVEQGDQITINYKDVAGYTFNSWSATGITLANSTSKSISITMPANDVIITLNRSVATYTITVVQGENGTMNPTTTSVAYNGT